MSYDPKYYQDKRFELEKKFQQNKDEVLLDITNTLNKFYNNQKDLGDRFNELKSQEEESQKKTEEANKKEIEKKIK